MPWHWRCVTSRIRQIRAKLIVSWSVLIRWCLDKEQGQIRAKLIVSYPVLISHVWDIEYEWTRWIRVNKGEINCLMFSVDSAMLWHGDGWTRWIRAIRVKLIVSFQCWLEDPWTLNKVNKVKLTVSSPVLIGGYWTFKWWTIKIGEQVDRIWCPGID